MSARTSRSSVAVTSLPLLRVQRTGDRHVIRELSADVTADFGELTDLRDDTRLRDAAQALAAAEVQEPEQLALTLALHLTQRLNAAVVHVDLAVHRWQRLDIGGRPRTSDFVRNHAELRTAHATASADGHTVRAGLVGMELLAADSEDGTPVLVDLDARWTYGWADVPFETQWQQVRRVITEAYAERQTPAGPTLAHALGGAVLDESPAVRAIELRLRVHGYRTLDVTRFGMESSPQLVSAAEPGAAVYVCSVERQEMQDLS